MTSSLKVGCEGVRDEEKRISYRKISEATDIRYLDRLSAGARITS